MPGVRVSAFSKSSSPRARVRPSRRLRDLTTLTVLLATVVSFAGRARAELPVRSDAALPALEDSAAGDTAAERAVAKIVLVGAAANDRELSLLIRELLDRQAIRSEIERADRLEPDALFAAEGRETLVLLALTDPHRARLQFRSPDGERYLLRKLNLAQGLDAAGRELIGQVVESSVVALIRTREGLTRDEAAREMVRESTPASPEPAPPPSPESVSVLPRAAGLALHPRLALRYAARWSGTELGAAHGPGIVAGLRWGRAASFGVELGVERSFAQALTKSALSADVQVSSVHALFELGWPIARRQALRLALGPALQLSRVTPLHGESGVAVGPKQLDTVPAFRAELRYELESDHFSVGAAAALDVWLIRVHYELANTKTTEELATPSLVRPGAVLWFGVH